MTLQHENLASVAERPHWTVRNGRATFVPVHSGWRAIVRRIQQPVGHAHYHVAFVDRTGATRFTMETDNLNDAVRGAERGVLARNALRLVPRN